MTTTTIREALTAATEFLSDVGIGSARLDAELLLAYVLRRDRAWLLTHDDETLDSFRVADFESLVSRRSEHVPLVHLTGSREFYGLDFEITPDVLTPRVETEQMVEWAIETAPRDGRLIDIGTGSGAIAIAIAAHRPDLDITATEVSPAALEVARRNAHKHGVKIALVQADLWDGVDGNAAGSPSLAHADAIQGEREHRKGDVLNGTSTAEQSAQRRNAPRAQGVFDTIVTNLPYLRDDARADLMPEVQREPAVALFGGADGLDLYRRFLREIPERLAAGGHLYTECDPWQHESLIAEAAKYGLVPQRQSYFILEFIKE